MFKVSLAVAIGSVGLAVGLAQPRVILDSNYSSQSASPAPATLPVQTATPTPTPVVSDPAPSGAEPSAVESSSTERPKRPKADPGPTAEERLREQLKVAEQLAAQGQKKEAISKLQLLLDEDRFDPPGFYNIGNAFARLDATDPAVKAYRKAIAQRKGNYSRASNNLGVILLRQGSWDQAYEAFLSALRTENFRYAEASYNLGRLYAARGEMDRASREWRRALQVDPNHQEAGKALNRNKGIGHTGSEALVARESISDLPAANSRSASAKRTPSSRPFTLDAESYELLQRARTAHEKGRYEEAVTAYKRVIGRSGGYFSPANLELGYSLIELGRNDEAIATLLLVVENDSSRFPIAYYHLGRLYERRGDLVQAEVNYLRATQLYQNENIQFLLDLSTVREKRGDFAGALVAMESYIKRKEQVGQKPDWADARVKELREKASASAKP